MSLKQSRRQRRGRRNDFHKSDEPEMNAITSRSLRINVCVSTRSIGFGVVSMLDMEEFRTMTSLNIYDLYRYGLTLFETKMKLIHQSPESWYIRSDDYLSLPYAHNDDCEFLLTRFVLPIQFATPLNALGLVRVNDKIYIPQIRKTNTTETEQFIPESEQILISTLRKTVEALSDLNTPAVYRKKFYNNNPIPGCIWRNAPDDPILINPDDIMPINYDYKNIPETIIRTLNTTIQKGALKQKDLYKNINIEPKGSMALLVCNNQNGMRIVDRGEGEDLLTYQSKCRIEGDIRKYHCLEVLTDDVQAEGCISLLGEEPVIEEFRYPTYFSRHENLCLQHVHGSYKGFHTYLLDSVYRPQITRNPSLESHHKLYPIGLCTTTRSMGFGTVVISNLINMLCPHRNTSLNIHQLYRFGLALFEFKIKLVQRVACNFNGISIVDLANLFSNQNYLPLSPIHHDFYYTSKLAAPLSAPVNALGLVKIRDKVYIPLIGKKNYTEDGQFIPQSEQILFSTLRETVQSLSNPMLPTEYRKKFYENNPIPGCIWSNAPEDPVLINHNEIAPNNDINDYMDGEDHFTNCMLLSDISKILNNTGLRGSKALLICNNQNKMRVSDRIKGEDLITYQSRCSIDGRVNKFESLEPLTHKIAIEGCMLLLGERPAIENLKYPVYLARHESLCSPFDSVWYGASLSNLKCEVMSEWYKNHDSSD